MWDGARTLCSKNGFIWPGVAFYECRVSIGPGKVQVEARPQCPESDSGRVKMPPVAMGTRGDIVAPSDGRKIGVILTASLPAGPMARQGRGLPWPVGNSRIQSKPRAAL